MNKIVEIWTDGSCDNKKKELGGGIGIVVIYDGIVREYSQGPFIGETVSAARMEVLAVVTALELMKPGFHYHLFSDNQYCVYSYNKGWLENWIRSGNIKLKAHSDLWLRFHKKVKELDSLDMTWIRGHAKGKYPYNEKADELAAIGRKNEKMTHTCNHGRIIN